MNANELRIGNLIIHAGSVITVTEWTFVDLLDKDVNSEYEPIPLTEELMIKAGFEANMYHDKRTYLTPKSENPIRHRIQIIENGLAWIPSNWVLVKLPFVHTLQNLIFALTGEELTVNLQSLVSTR